MSYIKKSDVAMTINERLINGVKVNDEQNQIITGLKIIENDGTKLFYDFFDGWGFEDKDLL